MPAMHERAFALLPGLLPLLATAACSAPSEAPRVDAGPEASTGAGVAVPTIDLPWRELAGQPDLGALGSNTQEPVDFGIWQAADGTWQLWSCIRYTKEPGGTRLFYRWEGAHFTDANWTPMGLAWQTDPAYGEMLGWPQAPFVVPLNPGFRLFYGDGNGVSEATSDDGKAFTRHLTDAGTTSLFDEGPKTNTRDPMVLRVGDHWIAYDSADAGGVNGVYARTSTDLLQWSAPVLVARGGNASGTGPYTAECPFVVYRPDSKLYYLFRNQRYGANAIDSVYASPDPMSFGIDDDRYFVTHLPVAAVEVVVYGGDTYLAALHDTLDGIHIAHLSWVVP